MATGSRLSRHVGAAVLTLFVAAGCSEQKKLLESAEDQHAAGDLDQALTTLELSVAENPKSDTAAKARANATQWLVAAADASQNAYEKKTRLEKALEWSPDSGPAQARLCKVLVDAKDHRRAQTCVDKDLEGKKDVPADIVTAVRAELEKQAAVRRAAERKRWLNSPSAHHWKALVERYPESEEAKHAKEKLARTDSLCRDLERFAEGIRVEVERQRELANGIAKSKRDDAALTERMIAYEDVGDEAKRRARHLRNAAGAVEVHVTKPGEEATQKMLRAVYWDLADSTAALAEDLERHPLENVDHYDKTVLAALRGWSARARATTDEAENSLETIIESCTEPKE